MTTSSLFSALQAGQGKDADVIWQQSLHPLLPTQAQFMIACQQAHSCYYWPAGPAPLLPLACTTEKQQLKQQSNAGSQIKHGFSWRNPDTAGCLLSETNSPYGHQVRVFPAVHEERKQKERQQYYGLEDVDPCEAMVQAEVGHRVLQPGKTHTLQVEA